MLDRHEVLTRRKLDIFRGHVILQVEPNPPFHLRFGPGGNHARIVARGSCGKRLPAARLRATLEHFIQSEPSRCHADDRQAGHLKCWNKAKDVLRYA